MAGTDDDASRRQNTWLADSSMTEMVNGDLQTLDAEWFVVGTSSRSEDFRIINNAPRGAGVVHE